LIPTWVRSFLVLLLVLGSVLALRGNAAASGVSRRVPWRSTSAPADAPTLLAFATEQPDSVPGGGGVGDTTGIEKEPKPILEPSLPPANQPPPSSSPSFSLPDTVTRRDSTRSFPGGNAAPPETIRPGPAISTFPTGRGTPAPAAPARRGLLGIHPIAILVGLIVLDIFIVKLASK
jgi:hypothetical protein